jgi:hypothetical protein
MLMKNILAAALLVAILPAAQAAEPLLGAAERDRARSLPHYATAGVQLPDGRLLYGNLVIAAYDDGRIRVEFSAVDANGDGGLQGELALANPEVTDEGVLRAQFRAPNGPAARYANHGTLAGDGLARGASVVRSDLRMDRDGLFALDVLGRDEAGEPVVLAVFGRAIGTCWADDGGTLRRVADLSKRPDCLRLFGGL